jgi:hypothetical protein
LREDLLLDRILGSAGAPSEWLTATIRVAQISHVFFVDLVANGWLLRAFLVSIGRPFRSHLACCHQVILHRVLHVTDVRRRGLALTHHSEGVFGRHPERGLGTILADGLLRAKRDARLG